MGERSWVLAGTLQTTAVGLHHYQPAKPPGGGAALGLRRDPQNAHDPNAIEVHNAPEGLGAGTHIGFLPRDTAKALSPWVDRGKLQLRAHSSAGADGFMLPLRIAVLARRSRAPALQSWLVRCAYGFRPEALPEEATTTAQREHQPAAKRAREMAGDAGVPPTLDTAASAKRSRSEPADPAPTPPPPSQEASQWPVATQALGLNTAPANTELGREQVFHGSVALRFDAAGAATIQGIDSTSAEAVVAMLPALEHRGCTGGWASRGPLDRDERYFLARMLQHLAPLLVGRCLEPIYPPDLVIPLSFRTRDASGAPLQGPMVASDGRQNRGRQFFQAQSGPYWVWADSTIPQPPRTRRDDAA